MKREIKYKVLNAPQKTVNDYLHDLNNDELQSIYTSSFVYGVNIPVLMKKIQQELRRRKVVAQPLLFS